MTRTFIPHEDTTLMANGAEDVLGNVHRGGTATHALYASCTASSPSRRKLASSATILTGGKQGRGMRAFGFHGHRMDNDGAMFGNLCEGVRVWTPGVRV